MTYLNTSQWLHKLAEWRSKLTLASACCYLFIILLVIVSIKQILSLYQVLQNPIPPKLTFSSSTLSPWQKLAQEHLFGMANLQEHDSDLPESNSNLILQGILMGGKSPKAILKGPSGNEEIYSVDSILPDGALIETIYPNYVVIRYNGMREKMTLIKPLEG